MARIRTVSCAFVSSFIPSPAPRPDGLSVSFPLPIFLSIADAVQTANRLVLFAVSDNLTFPASPDAADADNPVPIGCVPPVPAVIVPHRSLWHHRSAKQSQDKARSSQPIPSFSADKVLSAFPTADPGDDKVQYKTRCV